jgi:hypothetical protein
MMEKYPNLFDFLKDHIERCEEKQHVIQVGGLIIIPDPIDEANAYVSYFTACHDAGKDCRGLFGDAAVSLDG